MAVTRDEKWMDKYRAMEAYLSVHHQLPDKKKMTNRGLLDWWKYNRKCMKMGKLNSENIEMLRGLNEMRINKNVEW